MTDIYFFKPEIQLSKNEISAKAKDIVKKLAFKKYNLSENEAIIWKTRNGKPYFKNNPDLHFNISHSGNGLAIAFSDSPVGVDIEHIRTVNLKVADRYFSEKEKEYIGQSEDNKECRFFEIWTKKEAYIKRIGSTLSNIRETQTENIFTKEIDGYIISVSTETNEEPHIILENLENI